MGQFSIGVTASILEQGSVSQRILHIALETVFLLLKEDLFALFYISRPRQVIFMGNSVSYLLCVFIITVLVRIDLELEILDCQMKLSCIFSIKHQS
jgi:hypothetical protein